MVSGDGRTPTRVDVEDVRSVVDAINKAGGPLASATGSAIDQLQAVVRRNGQVILTSQFSDLLAGSDIAVQKGDEIVVRPNSRIFTVLGAVVALGQRRDGLAT